MTEPGTTPITGSPERPDGVVTPTPSMTADDLVAATGGRLLRRGSGRVRGGAVDSRLVTPGVLFVALSGERTDGHRYLADAAAAGATALLVGREPAADEAPLDALGDVTVVLVPDTLRGLHAVAAAWRRRFTPFVVGVTGSIAKTSTKEAVAGVLERRFRTLRTEGNQNNEVGMPLTVLRLGPEHEAMVLEMGMYTGGEIRELAAIGLPSVGIVTAVQPVHLSRIGSLDAIEDAKAELVEALPSAVDGGLAILNADDDRVRRMASRTRARARTYGFAADADIRAEDVASLGFDGMAFRLVTPEGSRDVTIPALGRLAVHNALAATAAGLAAGMTLDEIVPGLAAPARAEHRSVVHRAGGIVIVDDAYNASPGSVTAALELLAGLPGRHVAVLGEMRELGDAHDSGHRQAGEAAGRTLDRLVVVDGGPGGAARGIAEGALAAGLAPERLTIAADAAGAVEVLRGELRPGDVVLVKASRGIELEHVVDGLIAALGGGEAPA
ncbi:MAG TPA: UDP-N-acetylmuramoyl-tripeptide--D-alanyl-D-alanine ligase [Candidatus Limnocylindrales bacterium]|nr:UDP-N-acetylmuramoyl-tripeptide--D-alanyl-D-alanine ligase [Candidatus Limnocylindrales bacterium]